MKIACTFPCADGNRASASPGTYLRWSIRPERSEEEKKGHACSLATKRRRWTGPGNEIRVPADSVRSVQRPNRGTVRRPFLCRCQLGVGHQTILLPADPYWAAMSIGHEEVRCIPAGPGDHVQMSAFTVDKTRTRARGIHPKRWISVDGTMPPIVADAQCVGVGL